MKPSGSRTAVGLGRAFRQTGSSHHARDWGETKKGEGGVPRISRAGSCDAMGRVRDEVSAIGGGGGAGTERLGTGFTGCGRCVCTWELFVCGTSMSV